MTADTQYAAPRNMQAFLCVYDLDGNCLARRNVGMAIYSMHVMENAGGSPDVIAHTGRSIVRFAFDDEAPPPADGGR